MDNYNALSKSAILTKLALDGYFIDLLTLNSFIKEWGIEAIYENEFGIEFFDNTSYLTILNNLKTKYNKTKTIETPAPKPKEENPADTEQKAEKTELAPEACKEAPDYGFKEPRGYDKEDAVDLETLVKEAESIDIKDENKKAETMPQAQEETPKNLLNEPQNESFSLEELASMTAHKEEYSDENEIEDAIMPMAMKHLTPGPVAPDSNLNVDHDYIPEYNKNAVSKTVKEESPEPDTMKSSEKGKNSVEYDDELMQILQEEDFTAEEIEKADKLMPKRESSPKKEDTPETETLKETGEGEEKELDLIQLAQSFAQNLTGAKDEKEIPPADLEQIFEESYTEPFEELQNFVQKGEEVSVEEYESLKEDLPSDIEASNNKTASGQPESPAPAEEISPDSNLTAQNVREIIREEISRQTKNFPQIPNNDYVKNLVREIVRQTADVAPQNAFKLDISNRTLDLIAKAIAKKIAVKLNDYYKLNSSKQNAKLQIFREKTIELKEKNQALAEENKKLKVQLLESNRKLNSFKPAIFGLFKFEGKKRK